MSWQVKLGFAFCAALFLSLITIGINRPWLLMHEDDGIFTTTLALGHLKLGFSKTRGHNFQADLATGEIIPYPNHPPGIGLLMAGVIRLFGHANPAPIRLVPILFHSFALFLLVRVMLKTVGEFGALLGAYCLAVMPMSAFFGRSLHYGPFTLPVIILFVSGYFKWLKKPSFKVGLLLAGVVLLGNFLSWTFNFSVWSCLAHAGVAYIATRRKKFLTAAFLITLLWAGAVLLNLAHIGWAFGEPGLARIIDRLGYATHPNAHHPWTQIVGHAMEFCRRYFTEVVFISALAYLFLKGKEAIRLRHLATRDQVVFVFFLVGFLNLVAIPNYTRNHHYTAFYWIPFMTLAFAEFARWMRTRYPTRFKPVLAVCLILLFLSSGITLAKRHGRINGYTLKVAQELQRFL